MRIGSKDREQRQAHGSQLMIITNRVALAINGALVEFECVAVVHFRIARRAPSLSVSVLIAGHSEQRSRARIRCPKRLLRVRLDTALF